ncbi:concanavalin A-like lectin/glucanase domain-containing protein [Truncatella angustata]|uniref:Concanavalin A-like lectin/glucanase domain-containing protein n=1 Tax=Truncatella angustata TaxID=152316 RepID=A0A9P8UMH6_9PEZI|nr:concanavalin A-like lectin/glucanase domain-containing protein [Truncatella angustata]KAH6654818.1 concanavalin A-like lectin/glucanase domain-containing protein [Truncatella angustata]KAH8196945.1 hypothetical protein TruAng_008872 [Truncatella angustata]
MQISRFLTSLVAASTALAAPTELDKRGVDISCGSFGSLDKIGYTIYHNNFGASDATSGSQCTHFTGVNSDKSIHWSTAWTWAGGPGHVKSYSNVALMNVNKKLSSISSLTSTWNWSQTGNNVVADVSYDLWLAPTSGANDAYEIMIWLAAIGGALPISSTGNAIATVTLEGHSFKLYYGLNGGVKVYSFVASSPVYSFSGDVKKFLTYLTSKQGVDANSWVTHLQAGTEPFTGSNVVFTTSSYKLTIA